MNEVKTIWEKIEALVGGGPNGKERLKVFRWLVLAGLAGAGLMILQSFFASPYAGMGSPDEPSPAEEQETFAGKEEGQGEFANLEREYEEKIEGIIEKLVGVGNAEVAVTLESTEELVIARNFEDNRQLTEEQDEKGATRRITHYTRSGEVVFNGSNPSAPIVYKKIKPKIRGVVVVAVGAENPIVKKMIVEAVERGLGVPPHRVSVLPHKPES